MRKLTWKVNKGFEDRDAEFRGVYMRTKVLDSTDV